MEHTFDSPSIPGDLCTEPDGLSHGHWTQMQGDDF